MHPSRLLPSDYVIDNTRDVMKHVSSCSMSYRTYTQYLSEIYSSVYTKYRSYMP